MVIQPVVDGGVCLIHLLYSKDDGVAYTHIVCSRGKLESSEYVGGGGQ